MEMIILLIPTVVGGVILALLSYPIAKIQERFSESMQGLPGFPRFFWKPQGTNKLQRVIMWSGIAMALIGIVGIGLVVLLGLSE